jgi:hypothetical protein
LRPPALWACLTTVAIACAALAGKSDAGAHRLTMVTSALNFRLSQSLHQENAAPDPEAVTRQLAQDVRGLSEAQAQLTRRLAAVEQNLDDMTGSITRQNRGRQRASASALAGPIKRR